MQGISWRELTIRGQSNHAGTTPMAMRHDAGFAAGAITQRVRDLVTEMGGAQVGTVGVIDLHPDLINVVARRARITVDLRNTDEQLLEEAEQRLAEHVDEVADAEGVTVDSASLARFEPVVFDDRVVDLVEATAERLGHSVHRLPAGAGHDAGLLAGVCPAGMVFIPSHDGISHNPAEHTEPADLDAGADVLLQVLLALTEEDVAVRVAAAQMGPIGRDDEPGRGRRAPDRPAAPGGRRRRRAGRLPRAGADHLLPPLGAGGRRARRLLRDRDAGRRTPSRCSTRPPASGSASPSATPS